MSLLSLTKAAKHKRRLVLGLMSGTSLDGLDIALCRISGHGIETKVQLVHYASVDFDNDYQNRVREVFAKDKVSLPYLTLLNAWVAREHARIINATLSSWGIEKKTISLVASHGQTIMHTPWHQHGLAAFPHDATLQIGDGDHLAHLIGLPVLSDFRQKHIAAGGEGAPLALYGDFLLFSALQENRVLLNLGGIANLTWLPAAATPDKVISTDCGPSNTLLDAVVRWRYPDQKFDKGGQTASKGKIHTALLSKLLDHPFFELPFPKTTGPELFNMAYLTRATEAARAYNLEGPDLLATLCAFSASGILKTLKSIASDTPFTVYASGGGQHNRTLMRQIEQGLPPTCKLAPLKKLGINGDAKEAILFAVLANEWLCGTPLDFGNTQMPAVRMGKLSLPD